MTTPRDLFLVSMDIASDRPVDRGDLSLALAGAELIDLLAAQAIQLDDGRIVPVGQLAFDDRLLDEAASSLVGQAPYEPVEDWLWRRGPNLSAAYAAGLEAEGQIARQRNRRWLPFGASHPVLVDSLDRRQAVTRWASEEPVLAALAAALGIQGERTDSPSVADDAVATVLAAVHDALTELQAVRQRRAIEEAAFENIWRGDVTP